MDYYCEVCLKHIKTTSKYKYFKPNSHQEFNKCKHIILSHKSVDINDVDEAFYLHIIEHNKKFDNYPIKYEFKLVFNDCQNYPCLTSKLSEIKTLISWKKFLEKVVNDFKDKGYIFNHIAERHIITIANKMDMS